MARIYDDLRGLVEGELYFEPLDRAPYAIDASLYEIDPLGVVVPRSEHDVVNVVRYAAENRIAVHVRGAGTDTGGGSLGHGLIVDLSRHLRQVISIGGDHVVVEAGVVLDALERPACADRGGGSSPSTHNSDVMTVGGMIAVDAAGPRSIKYGSTGDQVDRLRVVFARGEVADVGFEPWPAYESEPADFKELVVRKLQTIFRNSESRLAKICPRGRATGPAMRSGVPASDTGIHLGKTACRLGRDAGRHASGRAAHGSPCRRARRRAAGVCRAARRRGLRRARSWSRARCLRRAICSTADRSRWRATPTRSLRGWIDESAEAILTVEFEGDEPDTIAARLRPGAGRPLRGPGLLVSEPFGTVEPAECDRLLGLRRLVEPLLMRSRGRARPVSIVDDVAVPPEQLAAVLAAASGSVAAAERHMDARRLCRRRPASAAAVPRSFRPRRSGQARAAGHGGLRHRARGRGHDQRRAGLRAGAHPVPPQAVR